MGHNEADTREAHPTIKQVHALTYQNIADAIAKQIQEVTSNIEVLEICRRKANEIGMAKVFRLTS